MKFHKPSNMIKYLYTICFAAVLFSCSTSQKTTVEVLPDHSLTIDEYISLGIPDPDKIWSIRDYRKASSIIESLANKDIQNLPRIGSNKSGKIIERIVSEENILNAVNASTSVEEKLRTHLDFGNEILKMERTYGRAAKKNIVFFKEKIEMSTWGLKQMKPRHLLGMEYIDQLTPSELARIKNKNIFNRLEDNYSRIAELTLELVSTEDPYIKSCNIKLASEASRSLPFIISQTPKDFQIEIKNRILTMIDEESNYEIKTALTTLYKSLD